MKNAFTFLQLPMNTLYLWWKFIFPKRMDPVHPVVQALFWNYRLPLLFFLLFFFADFQMSVNNERFLSKLISYKPTRSGWKVCLLCDSLRLSHCNVYMCTCILLCIYIIYIQNQAVGFRYNLMKSDILSSIQLTRLTMQSSMNISVCRGLLPVFHHFL